MVKNEGMKIRICTAPPGLYAVVKDSERAVDSNSLYSIQVVTAFKYSYKEGAKEIFSEPLVYCERKNTNALVDGKSRIEFVGTHENCLLKIKELVSDYYESKLSK